MMMGISDLNLNQFGGSMKEAMKRTVLQHEIIFKSQVRELHRLYWTQKNLMRELYRRELEAKECRQTVPPQSQVSLVNEGNVGCLEEVKGKFIDVSDNRHRGFNLELPADVYIGNSGEKFIRNELTLSSEMVRPGHSSEGAIEKRGGMVSLLDKGKNLYCYEVIDLEEPMEMESHVEAHGTSFNGFKIPPENCGMMGSSRSDNASDMASSCRIQNECGFVPYSNKESGFVPDLNHSHVDCNERWSERKADHFGAGGSESSVAGLVDVSTNSTHKQEPNLSKLILIDLNIPQDDGSSHAVNDPMITFPSPSSSSSVVQNELLWRDQGNRHLKETSSALNSEAPHSASRGKSTDWLFTVCHNSQRSKVSDFGMKYVNEADNKVHGSNSACLTACCRQSVEGLSSGSNGELPSDAKGTALSSRDFNIALEDNEDLVSGRLHSITQTERRQTPIVMANNITEDKQANHERSEEDTVSSHAIAREQQQDVHDEKVLTRSKSDAPTGSIECSSMEKIMDEHSGTTQLDNMVAESSVEKSCNIKQQHDQDSTIVDAAEILAGISLTQLLSPRKPFNSPGLEDIVTREDERDQPQCSSDSFETMTLGLPEVRSEEHLMPTTRQNEGDAGESASGANKLRRGRGRVVRDFQKDILPGMVSLSRHEICKDMHSIGYELRKNGSRRAGGGNWFVPVRSRRSRRYPFGRRQ